MQLNRTFGAYVHRIGGRDEENSLLPNIDTLLTRGCSAAQFSPGQPVIRGVFGKVMATSTNVYE
jgi:hypothetical protein